jgi:hypothetical protein
MYDGPKTNWLPEEVISKIWIVVLIWGPHIKKKVMMILGLRIMIDTGKISSYGKFIKTYLSIFDPLASEFEKNSLSQELYKNIERLKTFSI